jgi:hypothetical protein
VRKVRHASRPVWLFPVPVRQSSFQASAQRWAAYNVEVANSLIPVFSFDASATKGPILFYDYQTQLEPNPYGQLGSGRGGIYLGRYIKGVGRTPAAANWSRPEDRYHGSGHLSVASALRERLITVVLSSRGLRNSIVPCETLLLRSLTSAEQSQVRRGKTSSDPSFSPADGHLCALTVKPANFARPANFVFALNNFGGGRRFLGELFLDFERYLRPPEDRNRMEGAPDEIARAMEDSFFQALENFEAFARAGLLWVFIRGNFTLDGRFADLETPHFFGSPFVGIRTADPKYAPQFLGFEEFYLIRHWRHFVQWFHARLEFLCTPGLLPKGISHLFLKQLQKKVTARFPPNHLLFKDSEIQRRATLNLSRELHLNSSARTRLQHLARSAFHSIVYSTPDPRADRSWRVVDLQPAPSIPFRFQYLAPDFFEPGLSKDALRFADALERFGAVTDIPTLLQNASRFRCR